MAAKIVEGGIRSLLNGQSRNLLTRRVLGLSAVQPKQSHGDAWKKVAGVTDAYFKLPQPKNMVQLQYVWLDGTGVDFRAKTMTFDREPKCVEECPDWLFYGAHTYQGYGEDKNRKLKPVKMVKDPFRSGKNKLVLCEVIRPDGTPGITNYRASCKQTLEKYQDKDPWFGMEQEYTFLDMDGWPLKWPKPEGIPARQGGFFCSVGAGKAVARGIIEAHFRTMMYCGLDVGGINLGVMPAQAEFQIGPVGGVDAADQVLVARYLLQRVAEDYGVVASFDPKPVIGNWNGALFHCSFSSKDTRQSGGLKAIWDAIEKLKPRHKDHLKVYDPHSGEDLERRQMGKGKEFKAAVGDRSASIRIPRQVEDQGCGYLEDRRPSANCDPYRVTEILADTIFSGQSCAPAAKAPPKKDDPCDPCAKYWKLHR